MIRLSIVRKLEIFNIKEECYTCIDYLIEK